MNTSTVLFLVASIFVLAVSADNVVETAAPAEVDPVDATSFDAAPNAETQSADDQIEDDKAKNFLLDAFHSLNNLKLVDEDITRAEHSYESLRDELINILETITTKPSAEQAAIIATNELIVPKAKEALDKLKAERAEEAAEDALEGSDSQ